MWLVLMCKGTQIIHLSLILTFFIFLYTCFRCILRKCLSVGSAQCEVYRHKLLNMLFIYLSSHLPNLPGITLETSTRVTNNCSQNAWVSRVNHCKNSSLFVCCWLVLLVTDIKVFIKHICLLPGTSVGCT